MTDSTSPASAPSAAAPPVPPAPVPAAPAPYVAQNPYVAAAPYTPQAPYTAPQPYSPEAPTLDASAAAASYGQPQAYAQPQYAQTPYGQPQQYAQQPYAPAPYTISGSAYMYGAPRTNPLALTGMILSLVGLIFMITAIPGVICGHIALGQIKRTGDGGKGMAIAAIAVGYAVIAGLLLYIGFMVWVFSAMTSLNPGYY